MTEEPALDPDQHGAFLLDRATVERRRVAFGAQLTDQQREWADNYIGRCRLNATKASNAVGVSTQTGWKWRDRADVRRYCSALMAEAAAKLFISRDTVIAELAAIGTSDIAVVLEEIACAAAVLAQERDDGSPGTDDAQNRDGAVRPFYRLSASVTGPEIVARLGSRAGKVIRKVKFRSDVVREYEPGEDGKPVLMRETPIAVLDTVELHDKLGALSMLAPWFGLTEGSLSLDQSGGEDGWHGVKLVVSPDQAKGED